MKTPLGHDPRRPPDPLLLLFVLHPTPEWGMSSWHFLSLTALLLLGVCGREGRIIGQSPFQVAGGARSRILYNLF